jgi:glutathione S-transferase
MITLIQFPSHWNLPSASPFCIKLEAYLKLSKIPYQIKVINDPRGAPKGKLPFIKDGEKTIADTSLIIEYLNKTYGDKLDVNLTPEQKALAITIQRLCEDHLYWIIMYERWLTDGGWKVINPVFFLTSFEKELKNLVSIMALDDLPMKKD